MRKVWIPGWLLCCLTAFMPVVSVADSEQTRDQVSFQVDVGRDVENDRVIAVLIVNAEHKNPATLADNINSTMKWALDQVRAIDKVRSRSGSYQTYPVYDDKKIVRWRGRQELQLESQHVDQLSELVGTLQTRLQMQSLQFSVSPETRRQVEDGLIEQALAAYKERAAIITRALEAKRYDLQNIAIHTGGQRPIVPVRAEAVSMLSRAKVAKPALESGTSRITVQVSGSIHLMRD